jgi:hypothetical protein
MAKKKKKPEETEVDKPAESDNIQAVITKWVGKFQIYLRLIFVTCSAIDIVLTCGHVKTGSIKSANLFLWQFLAIALGVFDVDVHSIW